ncbi:MAG: hypothetical protein WBB45_20290 [Cyclobacteriaceae bacterium]
MMDKIISFKEKKFMYLRLTPFICILFVSFLSFSFSGNSSEVNNMEREKNSMSEDYTCYLTPAIVSEGNCYSHAGSPYGQLYSVYVSSGTYSTSTDRNVEVWIIHEQTVVDYAVVTIPAYDHISNNMIVFQQATEQYGQITLKIANVNRNASSACVWRETSPTVYNCYNSQGGGGLGFG